ncbi:CHAT domain-containing protein [Chryseolinea lacunae]|uniref:CHAT domain-containing protein n=1 Tax=Chryseolinea lacunae TaxID=2801331 RepID=A0ABS1L1J1_9BACT|nr:CHAT domain-containing tetratricopeptide repeat protein [Chryseolinea lacunae]MBL0745403.1 CHAT domain-containing protein [Chryseolinea lacunae]
MDMVRLRILFLMMVVAGVMPAAAQTVSPAQKLHDAALAIRQTDPAKAYARMKEAKDFALAQHDMDTYIVCVYSLSILATDNASQAEALVFLKEALRRVGRKQDLPTAKLHYALAELYVEAVHQFDSALYHYERAKIIRKNIMGEANESVAECYHQQGDVYKYYVFDFQEAEKSYEKALLIREHMDEKERSRPLYNFELARNYYSLATTNRSQQDYEKAIAYGMKTIELVKKINNLDFLERSYAIVANIYRDRGELKEAAVYYQKAIDLNPKSGNGPSALASHYRGMGEMLRNDSAFDQAIAKFLSAQALYHRIGETNSVLYVECLYQMAIAYYQKGDYEQAMKNFRRIRTTLQRMNMLSGRPAMEATLGQGDYHRMMNHPDSALYFYQQAMTFAVPAFHSRRVEDNPDAKAIGLHYFVYRALSKKAEQLMERYTQTKQPQLLQTALQCWMLTEELVKQGRNMLDLEESKWKYTDSNYNVYEQIQATLYALMKESPNDSLLNLSFRYFERSKTHSLNAMLAKARIVSAVNTTDSLFNRYNALTRALFSAEDALARETEKTNGQRVEELRQEVVAVDRRIQAIKPILEEKYPGYFSATGEYPVPSLDKVKALARQEKSVVLEYFWGSKNVYALAIDGEQAMLKKIGNSDSIQTVVKKLLTHFSTEHSSLSPDVFRNFTASAHQLYTILVQPFASRLSQKERIQVVPDGPVSQIPFEVLLLEPSQSVGVDYRSLSYLVKHYPVGYTYSASLLINSKKRTVHNPKVLAMGFTGGNRLGALTENLTEIGGTEDELKALEKRFVDGKFLSGPEVTETRFKLLAPTFDIIHLAIHGKGNTDQNYSASLYFRSRYDSLEDGELHAYELYGLKLKANLAVLSSCESGIGKAYRGEGMISMASAFVFSGCQNILMSLWKVHDQAAVDVMDNFYGSLQDGLPIDGALQHAKKLYLEKGDEITSDPAIWAPLVAYGDLNPVFESNRSRIYVATAVVLLILLLVFIGLKRRY